MSTASLNADHIAAIERGQVLSTNILSLIHI